MLAARADRCVCVTRLQGLMRRACRLPLIVAGSATSGVAVPLALTGAITALLVVLPFVDRGVSDTPVLFYTVPVGVCAVRFGLRGGLFAAAIGVAIAVAWHLDGDHFQAGLIGFGAQTAVFVSVGTLVGASADGRRGLARLLGMHELTDTIQLLSLAHSFEEVQEIVRHAARTLTGADGATFVLRDGGYCHYVDEDAISPLWKGQRFPLEACISGWSMLNREPAVVEDIFADERIPHDAYRPTFVKSLVMVPIRKTDPIGAIGNYWATQHRASQRELDALSALAESTAVALESVQAKQQLEESRLEVLHRLALAAECRDDETLEHTYRVATLSGLLAERLGLSTEEAAILGTAAPLHDIGKLGSSRQHPAQARCAQPRGAGADEAPHHRRRRNPGQQPLARAPRRPPDRAHPPRVVGRQRLSEPATRKRDPAQRPHRRPRRRVRRTHPRPPLQARLAGRRSARRDRTAQRPPIRSADRPGVRHARPPRRARTSAPATRSRLAARASRSSSARRPTRKGGSRWPARIAILLASAQRRRPTLRRQ